MIVVMLVGDLQLNLTLKVRHLVRFEARSLRGKFTRSQWDNMPVLMQHANFLSSPRRVPTVTELDKDLAVGRERRQDRAP